MKKPTSIAALLALCLFVVPYIQAQSGTEFWFAAPDVTTGHADRPIYLRFSDGGLGSDITVDMPANPGFAPVNLTLAADKSGLIELTADISTIEHSTADAVVDQGIRIVSTNPITAYYEVHGREDDDITKNLWNTDIFALKAENALGKEFYIPTQTYWQNDLGYDPDPHSGFIVVATEDNTQVTITPEEDIEGHNAGEPFTVNLDQGQSYLAQASGNLGSQHLGGSHVESDKPVAITIYDDSGEDPNDYYGGCRDLMGDQLIPVHILGNEYIAIRTELVRRDNSVTRVWDRVYVTAAFDNTAVYINGNGIPQVTLQAGEQYEYAPTGGGSQWQTVYINTSEPAYVLHVAGFGCEVGAAVLPPIYCTGSQSVKFTRSSDESFFLMALVPEDYEGDFSVTGGTATATLTAADFDPVAGTPNWMFAKVQFNTAEIPVGEVITIQNNSKRFQLGFINGGASSGCMYGYFSDFYKPDTPSIQRDIH